MNNLTVFQNPNFGQIRTITRDGEPWFVAADVCRALEIDRTQTRRLDEDEKGVYLTQTPGGQQELTIINEPGLYTLVLGSRKPEAKAFKRWITHEVIPAIRKTGQYSTNPNMVTIDREALGKIVGITVSETVKEMVPMVKEIALQVMTAKTSTLVPDKPKIRTRNPVLLKDFEQLLNETIKKQGVTGSEIASRMNVSKQTVSGWRNGTNKPNMDNYLRFVMEFHIPVSELGEGIF